MKAGKVRVDSVSLVIGGIALIAGELLHPEPPAQASEFLRMVAMHGNWAAIHALQVAAILILLLGLYALGSRFESAVRPVCAGFACLGATLLVAALVMDGGGFRPIALAWTASSGSDQAALLQIFQTALQMQGALLTLGAMCFYGIALFLFGLMLTRGRAVRQLGWAGLVLGAVFTVAGWISLAGVNLPPFPWYPLMALLFALWSLILGIRLRWCPYPLVAQVATN